MFYNNHTSAIAYVAGAGALCTACTRAVYNDQHGGGDGNGRTKIQDWLRAQCPDADPDLTSQCVLLLLLMQHESVARECTIFRSATFGPLSSRWCRAVKQIRHGDGEQP